MTLPTEIPVHYTEEDAGYVSVRPVVKQNFRLNELTDMVVRVTGKDASRVQKIFHSGTVIYNGYRYWWESIPADLGEIQTLLIPFPEDDPSLSFEPSNAIAAIFETGGGFATPHSRDLPRGSDAKKDIRQQHSLENNPRSVLRDFRSATKSTPTPASADLFRLSLPFDKARALVGSMLQNAPSRATRPLVEPPASFCDPLSRPPLRALRISDLEAARECGPGQQRGKFARPLEGNRLLRLRFQDRRAALIASDRSVQCLQLVQLFDRYTQFLDLERPGIDKQIPFHFCLAVIARKAVLHIGRSRAYLPLHILRGFRFQTCPNRVRGLQTQPDTGAAPSAPEYR